MVCYMRLRYNCTLASSCFSSASRDIDWSISLYTLPYRYSSRYSPSVRLADTYSLPRRYCRYF